MASINKVIIVGYLGRDPEKRYTPNQSPVTTIAVATSEKWKDRETSELRENTEWHRISFFGRLAETAAQYLKKGSQVYVEGRLRTRKYTDKDGIDRYTTEILADVMQMLDRRPSTDDFSENRNNSKSSFGPPSHLTHSQPSSLSEMDDDIPF